MRAKGPAPFEPPKRLTILSPTTGQPPSMLSALEPMALQAGGFSTLRNLRTASGALEVRPPTVAIGAAPFEGALPRGLWSGRLGGADWMLGAWSDGSRVRIYESANGGAAWTEVTSDAGAYGNTRGETAGAFVRFAQIDSDDLGDAVVMQNGTDLPRAFSRTARNGAKVATIREVAYPSAASDLATRSSASGVLPFLPSSHPSVTGATGVFASFPPTNTAGVRNVIYPGADSPANGDSFTLFWGAGADFSAATQFCLLTSANEDMPSGWIPEWKIELGEGASFTTVFDGGNLAAYSYSTETVKSASLGIWFELFSVDVRGIADTALDAVDRIRFTKVGAKAYGHERNVHGAFGAVATGVGAEYGTSPVDPALASYRVSLFNSGSGTESAGVTLLARTGGMPLMADLGVNQSLAGATALYDFTKVVFQTSVPIVPPTTAQRDLGVDLVKVYRQDVGSSEYLFAFSVPTSVWSGAAWGYAPGRSAVSYVSDTVTQLALENARFAPDAYSLPTPVGNALASANGRLHVGGDGTFAASEQNEPLRFRSAIAVKNGVPVSRSSIKASIPGEKVQGYAVVAGSVLAASSVVMFTTRKVYLVGGFDAYALEQPTPMSEIGCLSPRSIWAYKTNVYWLDDRRQIHRSNGGAFAPLSKRTVDDRLRTAVGIEDAVGVAYGDGYLLFHRQAGRARADRALAWDEGVGGWAEDENALGTAAAALYQGRVILQASDGSILEHAAPGASGPVETFVQTGCLNEGPWARTTVGRVGVVCDAQAEGATMSVVRRGRSGRTDGAFLNLGPHALGEIAWAWDRRGDGSPPGLADVGVSIELSATMDSGSRILGIVAEVRIDGEGAE